MSDKKELTIGTRVRWTSSASGKTVAKTGVIIGIVPIRSNKAQDIRVAVGDFVGTIRDPAYFNSEWKAWLRTQRATFLGGGSRPTERDEVSYLVRVPGKTAKHKAKIYQPRVSALEVVTP